MPKSELAWSIPKVEWSKQEERLVIAEMTHIGVIVMMNSHLFRWDGKIFLQRQGGPIGLRSTCAVARITMMYWDGKLSEYMEANNIRLDMGARYMDDSDWFLTLFMEAGDGPGEDYTSQKPGN